MYSIWIRSCNTREQNENLGRIASPWAIRSPGIEGERWYLRVMYDGELYPHSDFPVEEIAGIRPAIYVSSDHDVSAEDR